MNRVLLLSRALAFALPCIAMAQVAVLKIKVTEGEGAVYAPGARMARPLTVRVTDEGDRAVAGVAVSFRLPEDGPSGVFGNGLRTELAITDANGRAMLRGLQLNRTPGTFRIRITAAMELARAGTVVEQSIAAPAPGTSAAFRPTAASRSHKKWIVVGLAAAGVGGGLVAGMSGHSGGASAKSPTPVTIGAPSISLGRP